MEADHTKKLTLLDRGVSRRMLRVASAGRRSLLLLVPALVALLVFRGFLTTLFGPDLRLPIALASAVAVLILGALTAQSVGKALLPPLSVRFGVDTAGQVDFLIRIVGLIVVVLLSLSVAGVSLSGVFASAGVLTLFIGFASQQTLQQIIAGFVLLTTRRVKVGDRVKIHYPAIEGTVTRIGLLYSLFETKPRFTWNVPNATLLSATVTTVKAATPVSIKTTVKADDLEVVREKIAKVTTKTQTAPDVEIEGADKGEIELVVSATPDSSQDRARLERELAQLIAAV